jgi:ATP-dependent Clp protease ATP-binding subunit ClpC
MFERFTDAGRRVVVVAQHEARRLDHNYIGTEHILLGLINEEEGLASQALKRFGVSLDETRAEVERRIGRGKEPPGGHIPFTPRAKKVLELSLRQAIRLGHDYIGTEHVLLGVIAEGEGVAAQILAAHVDGGLTAVRDAVFELLGREPIGLAGIGIVEIGKRARSALGAIALGGSEDETRKRLEAIEARLSVIEQLLRRQLGEEEVS